MPTGVRILARSILRTDRVLVGVWIGLLWVMCLASAASTGSIYHSVAERVHAAEALNASPAIVALYGPILDPTSVGELAATKLTVTYAVFVALLFLVLVRRHTRTDEERGLAELIGSAPVGRDAPYAAAVAVSSVLAVVLGLGAALTMVAGGLPAGSSLVFGTMWAGTGLVGIGVTAIAVQLAASTRTCGAIAIGALLAFFLVRAIGDTRWHPLSWASPLGWNTQVRAWSHPRLWVLLLYPALTAVLLVAAAALRSRRDLGAGLVPDRPGPAAGPRWLASPLALAWRVHRTSVAVWTVVALVLGIVLGSIAPGVTKLLSSSTAADLIRRLGGAGKIEDSLLAAEFQIVALILTAFAIGVCTKASEDERAGLAEEVRATRISRTSLWIATAAVSVVGSIWLLGAAGVGAAVGSGRPFGSTVVALLAHGPAVAVTAGATLAILGARGRWTSYGWAVFGAFVVLGMAGELLKLPRWVIGISPYTHVPLMPSAGFAYGPEFALAAVAAALLGAGWFAYSRRDIG